MIELLKNYKELSNAADYKGNVRYILAKKKLDTLFIRWLKNNKDNVQGLLNKAKQGTLKASEQPAPFFSPRTNIGNNNAINLGLNNTIAPPKQYNEIAQSSKRTSLNQTYNPNLGRSILMGKSLTTHPQIKIDSQKIPQFYYPQGKPLDSTTESVVKEQVNTIFGNEESIQEGKIIELVQKVLSLPSYFAPLFIKKCCNGSQKLTKQQFQAIWKEFGPKQIDKKAFLLLTSDPNKKFLSIDDFKQLLKVIMDYHPGLQFLKSSPQFQQFYSSCVINRMFFMANRKNDYKMTYRQFKNSNILKSLYDIQAQPQINLNKDFFCYEDFYVIYIKFWQLDASHKFLLNKQEFSKYSGYTLSRKAVQRIFSQVAKKFQHPQCMTFGDFVWFIFCAEDKTTKQSIEYWFKILDLDNNGIITGYQLEFFFEEQYQRLGYMQNLSSDFSFENIICQMYPQLLHRIDLMKPKNSIQFTLDDFLKRPKQIGIFINTLTDLNKMIAYDQRDPYQDRAFKNDHPQWSDWDRFVKPEYKRVETMDENQGQEEVINWQNDQ